MGRINLDRISAHDAQEIYEDEKVLQAELQVCAEYMTDNFEEAKRRRAQDYEDMMVLFNDLNMEEGW